MSVFEQLGGADGVRRFVDELARRTADDAVLGPLFVSVEGANLQQHREHYFAAVLGGPEQYTGRGMREAHRSIGIRDEHVDRFFVIVDESLRAIGVHREAADAVLELLERLRPVIVSPRHPA